MAKITLELGAKFAEAQSGTDNLIASQQKLLDSTNQVKQSQQEVGRSLEDSQRKAAQQYVIAQANLRGLRDEYVKLIAHISTLKDTTTSEAKTLIESATKKSDAIKKLIEQNKDLKKAASEATGVQKDGQDGAKKKVEDTTNEIKKLRAEYLQLLSEAQLAGGAQTEAGRQALQKAGELLNKINDLKQATKAYGSETKAFDTAAAGFSLITNAAQGLIGIQALLGDDTVDYTKQLKELNAMMALNQSLTSITNALQAKSPLILGANTIATNIQTAAQQAYNIVVGESVGATKAFRLALAGTGIGLVVIGLIAAAEAFGKYRDEAAKAAEASKKEMEFAKMRADIYKQGAEDSAKEVAHIQALAIAFQNEKLPREERIKALREYNKIASEGNRIAETQLDNSALIQDALKRETELLIAKATVQAAEQELQNRIQKALSDQIEAERNLSAAREQAAKNAIGNTSVIDIDPALREKQKKQFEELNNLSVKVNEKALSDAKENLYIS